MEMIDYRDRFSAAGWRPGRFSAVAVLSLLLPAACGSDPADIQADALNQPCTDTREMTVDARSTSQIVTPEQGGTVQAGNVTLEVPPGALDEPVEITVEPTTSDDLPGPIPDNYRFVGGAKLGPDGTRFALPATLIVELEQSETDHIPVIMLTWNPAEAEWERTNYMTCKVTDTCNFTWNSCYKLSECKGGDKFGGPFGPCYVDGPGIWNDSCLDLNTWSSTQVYSKSRGWVVRFDRGGIRHDIPGHLARCVRDGP